MRDIRNGNCPLCDHDEVVEADPPTYGHQDSERDMTVTADPRWLMSGRNPGKGHGELRVWFCRSCGFAQWFVSEPATVPISDEHKTRLIKGKKDPGPFR
ncbi:MAG: hypothetical protein ACI9KE_000643 [Polyangiales bacterium]|jgi:hypothetical protein